RGGGGRGRFRLGVPVAKNPDGTPIVGRAHEEFVVDDAATTAGPLTYPAATLDRAQGSLTVRGRYQDPPAPVPATDWEYADAAGTAIPRRPAGTPLLRGRLYSLTDPAMDPRVVGPGFAAIRDFAAFLRHAAADDRGNPNPLAGRVQLVYSFCVSQPCRTLHDFLWLGFTQDEAGRRVIDGMLNWIGGGSGI